MLESREKKEREKGKATKKKGEGSALQFSLSI